MPKETQPRESCSTSLQVGRLVMPAYHKSQNIDLNDTAMRTCESALISKRFQLLRNVDKKKCARE